MFYSYNSKLFLRKINLFEQNIAGNLQIILLFYLKQ